MMDFASLDDIVQGYCPASAGGGRYMIFCYYLLGMSHILNMCFFPGAEAMSNEEEEEDEDDKGRLSIKAESAEKPATLVRHRHLLRKGQSVDYEEVDENTRLLQDFFVISDQHSSKKKPAFSLRKKSRSLPSLTSALLSEPNLQDLIISEMVLQNPPPNTAVNTSDIYKRGYFYESVGGVYYTLDWPLKSSPSSSSNHEDFLKGLQQTVEAGGGEDSGRHSMHQQEIAVNQKSDGENCKSSKETFKHSGKPSSKISF